MSLSTLHIILFMIGGLGLFMFGIKSMEDALKHASGECFKKILKFVVRNRFSSFLVGLVTTTFTQSSTATTVMVVGLINAGFITLFESMGFILGANVGTTATGQLMSFKLDAYAMPALGLGALIYVFSRQGRIKYLGEMIFGLGAIFYGMSVMKDTILPLQQDGTLETWFSHFNCSSTSSMMMGLLISLACTAVIHSGATIGIIITLASVGTIKDIGDAIPLILGANIGTCVVTILASLKSNAAAKKAALAHFTFNFLGAAFILASYKLWIIVVPQLGSEMPRQIANAHTLFKILETIMFMPFIYYFVKLFDWILPDKIITTFDILKHKDFKKSEFLKKEFLKDIPTALIQAHKEVENMVKIVSKMLSNIKLALINKDVDKKDKVLKYEDYIDAMKKDVHDFLILLTQQKPTSTQAREITLILTGSSAMERVADHIESMIKFVDLVNEKTMILDDNNKSRIIPLLDNAAELIQLIQQHSGLKGDITKIAIEANMLGQKIEQNLITTKRYYDHCISSGSWNLPSDLSFIELVTHLEKFYGHCYRFISKYINPVCLLND